MVCNIWHTPYVKPQFLFSKHFYTSLKFRDNTIKLFIVRQVLYKHKIHKIIYVSNSFTCRYYLFYCIIYIILWTVIIFHSFHYTDYFTNDSSINLKLFLLLNISTYVYKENIVSHHYVMI